MDIRSGRDHYLLQLEKLNKSRHTLKQYRIDLEQLEQFANEQRIDDVTTDRFAQFAVAYETVLIDKGFKPTSVRRKVSSLRSFLRFLHTGGWLNEPLHERIVHTQAYRVETTLPTLEEVAALYSFYPWIEPVESYAEWTVVRNRTILRLMIDTGMKVNEICQLRYGQIGWHDKELSLYGREGTFRTVDVPRRAILNLDDYVALTAAYFDEAWQSTDYVFFSDRTMKKRVMSERTVERLVQRATESLGTSSRGSELRYFRLLQKALQTEDEDVLTERFGYRSAAQLEQRLNWLLVDQKKTKKNDEK